MASSEAKPEVWKEMPAFKAAAEKMQGEVAKLQAAAKTGDVAQLKVAVGATFQCPHDQVRVGVHRQDQHFAGAAAGA